MEIKCPACPAVPPVERWRNEDVVAYTYRKWKWLANHMATDHMRQESLIHRRMVAREKQLQHKKQRVA